MVNLPAKCTNPQCDYVDASPGAVVIEGDTSGIVSSGNFVGRGCRKCGSDMLVMEGKFSTKGGALVVDDGPEWTERSLWEIRTALEYARDNLHSRPEEARRRVEDISPFLADAIWDRVADKNLIAIATHLRLVIAVVSLIIALRGSSETPPQTLAIVQNVLLAQQREGEPLGEKEIEDVVRRGLVRPGDGVDR